MKRRMPICEPPVAVKGPRITAKVQKAMNRLQTHRTDYQRQYAERIRRLERFLKDGGSGDPEILNLIANPLGGL